ncbi:MAG: hypothetical protein ACFFBD_10000 [Candidatus Hodarchaeota archaeon]
MTDNKFTVLIYTLGTIGEAVYTTLDRLVDLFGLKADMRIYIGKFSTKLNVRLKTLMDQFGFQDLVVPDEKVSEFRKILPDTQIIAVTNALKEADFVIDCTKRGRENVDLYGNTPHVLQGSEVLPSHDKFIGTINAAKVIDSQKITCLSCNSHATAGVLEPMLKYIDNAFVIYARRAGDPGDAKAIPGTHLEKPGYGMYGCHQVEDPWELFKEEGLIGNQKASGVAIKVSNNFTHTLIFRLTLTEDGKNQLGATDEEVGDGIIKIFEKESSIGFTGEFDSNIMVEHARRRGWIAGGWGQYAFLNPATVHVGGNSVSFSVFVLQDRNVSLDNAYLAIAKAQRKLGKRVVSFDDFMEKVTEAGLLPKWV